MALSYYTQVGLFKSPLKVIAACLLRSRETQAQRAADKTVAINELKHVIEQQTRTITNAQQALAAEQRRTAQLTIENQRLRAQPPVLPHDPPLPHHQFGPQLIALCVNLARTIGLRASIVALRIMFDWLRVDEPLPAWTTVRLWLMRAGVAALEEPVESCDDMIWLADHSNQIGTDKALVILGVRASELPPPGTALRHEDMRVLAVVPGTTWKTEQVAQAYKQLADQIGNPLALVVDGACELRDGAEILQKRRPNTIILGDFKHHAANVLKRVIGHAPEFVSFNAQVGSTRSAVQQTELGHFTPPSPRPKARFMNLAPLLTWAAMVLWQLDHPQSQARRALTEERMREKFGWLKTLAPPLANWNACQAVVSAACTFVNGQGLAKGAADRLASQLQTIVKDGDSQAVADELVAFVRLSEAKLTAAKENDVTLNNLSRLPMSTEILESAFGLFKQLERQHSKGGFTSLLAAFGALLKPATAESIRRDFARVSVKQMRTWVTQHLQTTLGSKRKAAYSEFTQATSA